MARITFARDYTSAGGRHYRAGSTHNVDGHIARSLIVRGTARAATDEPARATAAPAEKAGSDTAAGKARK